MFDFDYEEEKTPEQREKELFEQNSKKQAKVVRKVLVSVFGFLGIAYLLIGAFSLIFNEDQEMLIVGFVFGGLGLIFLLAAIILFFALPKQGNYEKYKANVNHFGYTNPFTSSTRITMLEEENKELRNRLNDLEKKIKEMEDR